MKPFSLEQAKAGAPLVTRDGREAVFIAHAPEARKSDRIVFRVGERIYTSYESGAYDSVGGPDFDLDLFMAPVKRKVWIGLQGPAEPGYPGFLGWVYASEAAAREAAPDVGRRFIEVEIEE